MKKKLLTFSVIFVFAVLLVAAFAVNASAASATCPANNGGAHYAGTAADCENACVCLMCGEELTAALGHNAGSPATCGSAQKCTTCQKEIAPALGNEYCVGDRDAADCTNDMSCKTCLRLMERHTGHSIAADAHVDCGHAIKCQTCHAITQNAEGAHTFDWANAVTVREATETSPKLVDVKCTTCNRTYERVYEGTTTDSEGLGSVDATPDVVGATLKVDTLKRADYADTKLGKKYDMLQTFKLTMEKGGVAITPTEARVVTMTLNNAAAKAENIKVFAMKDDGSYEEMNVVSTENGKVRFETTYFSGTQFAIVDADSKGLSTGALIGIIAGAVGVVAIAAVVVVVVLSKKKKPAAE